jgi:beta-phosphoglucomutase
MKWIHKFQFFLFDFDGLLVDTDYLHYQSYIDTIKSLGHDFDWSYARYCEVSHLDDSALLEELYGRLPQLDPDWNRVYNKKNQLFLELLEKNTVKLMPGVARLLKTLEKEQIRRCVVTNSGRDITQAICAQLPILNTIKFWVTREEYANSKPDPDCYLRAIELHGRKGDRIIGFEDSWRGIVALQKTPALPVLICSAHHPLLRTAAMSNVLHFETIDELLNKDELS